jgi:hypothetical protein
MFGDGLYLSATGNLVVQNGAFEARGWRDKWIFDHFYFTTENSIFVFLKK